MHLARLLLLASILYVVGFYFIGSAVKPGYSQISNFVSEYNATGTAWADMLTYAGFAATAAILSGFLAVAIPLLKTSGASRVGAWLLWSLPASYFLAVIAPCDTGCPLEGSASQIAHNLLAVVTYFGMGLSIVLISLDTRFSGFKLRRVFLLFAGAAFPVVFLLMVQPELGQWGGLLQRLLDIAMAVSLIVIVKTLIPTGHNVRQAVA
ncbi:hypothetical protein NIPOLPBK_02436 [Stenotrophomonas maltophilia]|nr:hypothetical protein NIPOLPBK_02436 [Stenotrophomonas maltophilia]WBL66253.1 hypothetical protein SMAL454_00300 [Stenotrophomonas maltophilia]